MPNTTTKSKGYKELEYPSLKVLKSYETIIAILDLLENKLIKTEEFYSQSTTRHLKLFKSRHRIEKEEEVSQNYIDFYFTRIDKGVYV